MLAAALALAAAWAGEAGAGRVDGALQVTAQVPLLLEYRLIESTDTLTLTDADLAAGVKDLSGAGVLSVSTNSPDGLVLEVGLPADPWLAAVEVRVAGVTARGAPGDLVRIAWPNAGTGEILTPVDLHLELAAAATAGTFPLTLSLGLTPL